MAAQLGIDEAEVDARNIDPVEFLRAQGEIRNINREERAFKEKEERLKKDCTFAPKLKKKPMVTKNLDQDKHQRVSTGSINLAGLANQKQKDPFKQADGSSKFNELYNMRKNQYDKRDKTKEDYEFEKQQEECTFTPQLYSNKYNAVESSVKRRNEQQTRSALGQNTSARDR